VWLMNVPPRTSSVYSPPPDLTWSRRTGDFKQTAGQTSCGEQIYREERGVAMNVPLRHRVSTSPPSPISPGGRRHGDFNADGRPHPLEEQDSGKNSCAHDALPERGVYLPTLPDLTGVVGTATSTQMARPTSSGGTSRP